MRRALALLGGGSKGAYQVGAISHMLGHRDMCYDIYSGVSVGALNAAMLAAFPEGQERDACATLMRVWDGLTTKRIRRGWNPFGALHMFWRPSIYDSTPLIQLVREQLDPVKIKASGKKLSVGTVSLNTGQYRTFDQDHPAIVDAVLASSSFPAMFCPIEIEGQLWTDGGLRNVSLLSNAINLGADAIDVIMTSPPADVVEFTGKPNALDIIVRSLDMISDEIMECDLKLTQFTNRLVRAGNIADKKHVEIRILRPQHRLPAKSLEFDPKQIRYLIELGQNDAAEFYKQSP